MDLISMNDAVAQGIERIRQPNWANPQDYLKIDIVNGKVGPWLHLYSPANEIIGSPNPQHICWILQFGAGQADEKEFEPYTDKIDPDEKATA